eukprot:TRINITY_DN10124_c0_g1_i1.p1 TRINITY_DN10124_c0_g1~~TRINITY_DN10124_c0_g1_i1.p1  ORF type:complete len:185 (+),score=29.80 TRINITY_DN10124_c0_g1_i1:320-874(+)
MSKEDFVAIGLKDIVAGSIVSGVKRFLASPKEIVTKYLAVKGPNPDTTSTSSSTTNEEEEELEDTMIRLKKPMTWGPEAYKKVVEMVRQMEYESASRSTKANNRTTLSTYIEYYSTNSDQAAEDGQKELLPVTTKFLKSFIRWMLSHRYDIATVITYVRDIIAESRIITPSKFEVLDTTDSDQV